VVGAVVKDAVSSVASEGVAGSGKGVESEGVVPGTVAELTAALALDLASGLASDLPAEIEFGCGELRLALELLARVGAPLGAELESAFLLSF
jgi:hypothetical protein